VEALAVTADRQALELLMSLAVPEPVRVPATWPPQAGSGSQVRAASHVRTSGAWAGLATGTGWPIAALLVVQALLSMRLIWSNTASSDEALYLWAGRLELSHLIHGGQVPDFATYFSGSPVVYPPVGAVAVSIGGLAGHRADGFVAAAAATLALANATKYASALFDPVVIGVAVLAVWRSRGGEPAARAGAIVAGALTLVLALGLLAGGRSYLHGLGSTTLDRQARTYSAPYLLMLSGKWLWAVALLAGLGVLTAISSRSGPQFALLVGLLAAAVLLAPAEQARIHTETSLFKHVDFGAWFGCAAAGYAVAALSRVVSPVKAAAAFRTGVIAVALAVLPSIPTGSREYNWPGAATLLTSMRHVLPAHPGPILSDDGSDLLHFYLRRQVAGATVDGTFFISYSRPGGAHPQTGLAGYAAAIRSAYFSVILLEFVDNLYVDGQIERCVSLCGGYRLIDSIPHAAPGGPGDNLIWVRKGQE
jgi:hypothetical protein